MNNEKLSSLLKEAGYSHVKLLKNGWHVGIMKMIETTGLFVKLDEAGYAYRYCYHDWEEAAQAVEEWDGEDHPPGPWIKRKGLGSDLNGPGSKMAQIEEEHNMFQKLMNDVIQKERNKIFQNSPQLTLGELIDLFEKASPDATVEFDFEYAHPTHLDSWRGSYSELAISFSFEGESPKVSELLKLLKEADGKVYDGYKGGEYKMSRSTPLWVANYGNSGRTGVVGVTDREYSVTIHTAYCEF